MWGALARVGLGAAKLGGRATWGGAKLAGRAGLELGRSVANDTSAELVGRSVFGHRKAALSRNTRGSFVSTEDPLSDIYQATVRVDQDLQQNNQLLNELISTVKSGNRATQQNGSSFGGGGGSPLSNSSGLGKALMSSLLSGGALGAIVGGGMFLKHEKAKAEIDELRKNDPRWKAEGWDDKLKKEKEKADSDPFDYYVTKPTENWNKSHREERKARDKARDERHNNRMNEFYGPSPSAEDRWNMMNPGKPFPGSGFKEIEGSLRSPAKQLGMGASPVSFSDGFKGKEGEGQDITIKATSIVFRADELDFEIGPGAGNLPAFGGGGLKGFGGGGSSGFRNVGFSPGSAPFGGSSFTTPSSSGFAAPGSSLSTALGSMLPGSGPGFSMGGYDSGIGGGGASIGSGLGGGGATASLGSAGSPGMGSGSGSGSGGGHSGHDHGGSQGDGTATSHKGFDAEGMKRAGGNPLLIESMTEGAKRAFGDPNDKNTRYVLSTGGGGGLGIGSRAGPSFHNDGRATDLQIFDRKTGKFVGQDKTGSQSIMKNAFGNKETFAIYDAFHRSRYDHVKEKYGEAAANRITSGSRFTAKQGHVDQMHASVDEGQSLGRLSGASNLNARLSRGPDAGKTLGEWLGKENLPTADYATKYRERLDGSEPAVASSPNKSENSSSNISSLTLDKKASIGTDNISRASLYATALEKFQNSPLNGYVPKDGERWGIKTGSPEEWARLAVATAQQESSINPRAGGGGLYQFESGDLARYGQGGKAVSDPNAQLGATITQWEKRIPTDGIIAGKSSNTKSGWGGASDYFGSFRRPNETEKYINNGFAQRAQEEAMKQYGVAQQAKQEKTASIFPEPQGAKAQIPQDMMKQKPIDAAPPETPTPPPEQPAPAKQQTQEGVPAQTKDTATGTPQPADPPIPPVENKQGNPATGDDTK